MKRTRLFATFALAFNCLLAFQTGIAHAQTGDPILRGSVLGPDSKPLPGQLVVLHRVAGTTGVTVASGTSDDSGGFALHVPDADVTPDAVYFLAARYTDNELYIGNAFRAPFDTAVRYVVQVGTPETSARALVGGGQNAQGGAAAAPAPVTDPSRWLVWLIPAAAIVAAAVALLFSRTRIPAHRRVLTQIARLDAQNAVQPDASYAATRAALIGRIRQTGS